MNASDRSFPRDAHTVAMMLLGMRFCGGNDVHKITKLFGGLLDVFMLVKIKTSPIGANEIFLTSDAIFKDDRRPDMRGNYAAKFVGNFKTAPLFFSIPTIGRFVAN